MEKYEQIVKEYVDISSSTRSKLTAISITIIAAIYFFFEPGSKNDLLLKISLVFIVLTIFIEVLSDFLRSQHYALWIDGKIDSIDFRHSKYGIWAERLFGIPMVTFLIGAIIFFIGIFI
jgi:hypothetical protein